MKAKFLPTMIGAILAGGMGVAQADVQVFGHLDTAVVSFDQDENYIDLSKMPASWSPGSAEDDVNLVCTTCSVGFKGSEDLGNGMKAIFKLDFQFDTINRNRGAITDRDQWVGLKGNFGQVRIGTISTGYKSHGAMIDPLYRTAVQGRSWGLQSFLHSGAGEDGEGRATNTIRYDSPSFNGLKVVGHYTLDSDEGDGILSNEDDDAYGIGASYQNGGILVFADYLTNNSSTDKNDHGDLTAWKVGGKYSMNNFAVMGQYESVEDDLGANEEGEMWHIGGSYTMGNNMIYAAYGMGEIDISGVSADPETETFTIAGMHSMSKRTKVYAAYVNQSQDADLGVPGDDPEKDAFAVGLKHKF